MWNYRIMRHIEEDKTWYGLHEVYYNDKDEIVSWTVDPEIFGDDVVEIESTLAFMIGDIKTPEHMILDYDMEPEGDWGDDWDDQTQTSEKEGDEI